MPAKDLPLTERIRACRAACRGIYDYRRAHIWLERHGIHRDLKTVLRVMNKHGLLAGIRRKRYVKYGEALHRYLNLLNRDLTAEIPNQKWITDISCIRTGQGFLYRSAICDLYDNSIVACKTETGQTVRLVLSALRTARKKEKITAELQPHRDQGFRYTSQAYSRIRHYSVYVKAWESICQCIGRKLFSILKTEYICRARIASFEETRRLIDDDIYFNNHERIQLKTK